MRRRRTPVDYHGAPLQADEVYVAVASYATDHGVIRRGHEMRGDDPRLADHAARFIRRGSPMPAADVANATLARDVAAPAPTTHIQRPATDEDWVICVEAIHHVTTDMTFVIAKGERRPKTDPMVRARPGAFISVIEHRKRERAAEEERDRARAHRKANPLDSDGKGLAAEREYVALADMAVGDPDAPGGVRWIRAGDRLPGADATVRATSTRWAPVTS